MTWTLRLKRFVPLLTVSALLVAGGETGSAHSKNHAIVLYAHGGEFFIAEAKALAAALRRRGYATQMADTDTKLVHPFQDIQRYLRGEPEPGGNFLSRADALQPHDRLLLAIECDGGLNAGVYRRATDQVDENGFVVPRGQGVGNHNACSISSGQIANLAKVAKERDIEMIVIDSSCSGGATTFVLEPMDVCAISTAAPGSPAVTGDPPFSQYLGVPFVKTFSDMAVAGSMTIFAQFPERHQQSGYYSTAGGHAGEAMTLRAALFAFEQSLSGWTLWTSDVYPYVYQAAATPAVRAKLGMRDPPPAPASPDLAQLMKMADNYDGILQDVLRTVQPRWAQEDAELATAGQHPGSPAARKIALFESYRSGEFVTSPLQFSTGSRARGTLISRDQRNHVPLLQQGQIPPTIPFTHQMILRLIGRIQENQRVLTTGLARLEADVHARRNGTPASLAGQERGTLAAILRARETDEGMVGLLSKLLGLMENVESRSDRSPCDVAIN